VPLFAQCPPQRTDDCKCASAAFCGRNAVLVFCTLATLNGTLITQTARIQTSLFSNLTFMGPCIVTTLQYTSNKMQRYTVYIIWKLLYMFRVVPAPIIRSANNYLQYLVFVTPLLLPAATGTGLSVLWVAYATHSTLKPVPTLPR
jgi:hypothetical protein